VIVSTAAQGARLCVGHDPVMSEITPAPTIELIATGLCAQLSAGGELDLASVDALASAAELVVLAGAGPVRWTLEVTGADEVLPIVHDGSGAALAAAPG
jgi:hypothetical protein